MITLSKSIYFIALITTCLLFALWNFPSTISLRYLCYIILLFLALTQFRELKYWARVYWPIILFLIYIIIHAVLIAPNSSNLFSVYWKDWLKSVLITFIAAGVGVILYKNYSTKLLLCLGLATAIPSLVHVAMTLYKTVLEGSIPWGYAGINGVHGYFATLSLQAAVLIMGYLLFNRNTLLNFVVSLSVMGLCIVSNVVALSRGGVLFMFITLIFSIFIYLLFFAQHKIRTIQVTASIIAIGVIFSLLYGFLAKGTVGKDWGLSKNLDKIKISLIGDPININCKGLPELKKELYNQSIALTPTIEEAVAGVDAGDAARVMTARAGLALLWKNPWGTDGSRNGYNRALEKICQPAIKMAHTHNAWIDTALSIGIVGALLLLTLFIRYAYLGWTTLKKGDQVSLAWSYCLLVLSVVWVFRGLLDATLITHTLEMQVFTLSLLAAMVYSAQYNNHTKKHE